VGATRAAHPLRFRGEPLDPATDLRPALGAGLGLLVLGAVLVAVGGVLVPGASQAMSVWVAIVGLVLVLGAMVAALLRPLPAPAAVTATPPGSPPFVAPPPVLAPGPAPTPERVARRAPAGPGTGVVAMSVRRAVALPAETPAGARSGAAASASEALPTSIPAAYLQSVGNGRFDTSPWGEMSPPIAAALPFAAGIPRSPEAGRGAPGGSGEAPAPEAFLELEMARLRARVRELETRRPLSIASKRPPPTAPAVSAAEPPSPPKTPAHATVARRGCIGCGTSVGSTTAPLLCWGCGRALCSGCYWRFGPGPGLHRCPDCLSHAPAPATGGSEGGALSRSGAVVVPPDAAAPPTPLPSTR
jgi:hypothetical protein